MFSTSGFWGITGEWNTTTEANNAYDVVGDSVPLKPLVVAWIKDVGRRLTEISKTHPEWLLASETPSGGILTGAFVGSRGAVLDGILVEFFFNNLTYRVTAQTLPLTYTNCPSTPLGNYCLLGEQTIALEFANQTSVRAREETKHWPQQAIARSIDRDAFRALRLVEESITYDKTGLVGGKANALMLQGGGNVEWIVAPTCNDATRHHK